MWGIVGHFFSEAGRAVECKDACVRVADKQGGPFYGKYNLKCQLSLSFTMGIIFVQGRNCQENLYAAKLCYPGGLHPEDRIL